MSGKTIKVLSLFSGIGSFESALERLNIKYELTNYCEIDKYASCSYCSIHNIDESLNLRDVTKINPLMLEECDLITHGSPCQDFSVAGKQAGGDKNSETRSSLMWYTVNIIKVKYPKFVIWENVKNVLSKRHRHNFDKYIHELDSAGYNSYYKVLNTKDYGIPQNRERIFCISIRKDIDKHEFEFPKPFDNGLRLKDMLENEVDKKYYISQEKCDKSIMQSKEKKQEISYCINANYYKGTTPKRFSKKSRRQLVCLPCITLDRVNKRQNGRRFKENDEPSFTLTAQDKRGILEVNKFSPKPELIGGIGEINFGKQYRQGNRVYSSNKTAMCILSQPVGNSGGYSYLYEINHTIRKLTPLECWRLQGFTDREFKKVKIILNNTFYKGKDRSNSQLYKQAGNSITVNVLVKIYKSLFKEYIE